MGYYSYPKGDCGCHFRVSRDKSLIYRHNGVCTLMERKGNRGSGVLAKQSETY